MFSVHIRECVYFGDGAAWNAPKMCVDIEMLHGSEEGIECVSLWTVANRFIITTVHQCFPNVTAIEAGLARSGPHLASQYPKQSGLARAIHSQ